MELKEFKERIKAIQQFLGEIDTLNAGLEMIARDAYSEFGGMFLDDYISLLSESVGDKNTWIEWFVFENEFGKKAMEAGYRNEGDKKKLKKIKTVEDLWKLIQEGKIRDN